MEIIFQLINLLVIPFWVLMIVFPRWHWSQHTISSPWIVAPVALAYIAMVMPNMADILSVLTNPTAANIAPLLGTPEGATIAWAHFLAFDLFVGRWVYLDSQRRNMTAWLVSPILLFCFMFGPLGLLLYLIAQFFFKENVPVDI